MSQFSSRSPFQLKATELPSGEKVACCSRPGYVVSGTAVKDAAGRSGGLVRPRHENPAIVPAMMRMPSPATMGHGRRRRPIAGDVAMRLPESRSSFRSCKAAPTSAIDCQRRSGSFRRQRAIVRSTSWGSCSRSWLTGFGSSCRIADSVPIVESRWKARCPVTIS